MYFTTNRYNSKAMRILGIDPGIGRTGWGVIEVQSSNLKVQSYGCIETDSKTDLGARLTEVYDQIEQLLKEYKPVP